MGISLSSWSSCQHWHEGKGSSRHCHSDLLALWQAHVTVSQCLTHCSKHLLTSQAPLMVVCLNVRYIWLSLSKLSILQASSVFIRAIYGIYLCSIIRCTVYIYSLQWASRPNWPFKCFADSTVPQTQTCHISKQFDVICHKKKHTRYPITNSRGEALPHSYIGCLIISGW